MRLPVSLEAPGPTKCIFGSFSLLSATRDALHRRWLTAGGTARVRLISRNFHQGCAFPFKDAPPVAGPVELIVNQNNNSRRLAVFTVRDVARTTLVDPIFSND